MKKNRRISVAFIIMALLLVSLPGGVFAQASDKQPKVKFNTQEITDKKVLYQRAINGESDYNGKMKHEASITNLQTNEKVDVEVKSTTQLLKTIEYPNGVTEDQYSTTSFAVVPESVIGSQSNEGTGNKYSTASFAMMPESGATGFAIPGLTLAGSHYDEGWDTSYSVKAYSTFNWTYSYDPNGLKYAKLTSANGGWDVGSGFTINTPSYKFIAIGWSYGSAYHEYQSSWTSCGTTFSGSAPSSWQPIYTKNWIAFGTSQKCNIVRSYNHSTWYFQWKNDIGGGI